jgi:dTDP-L-rhamnose 4-epimerase
MRVLVTGGAGFIGLRVVRQLVAAGHEVRVLDALLERSHVDTTPPEFPAGVEFVHGDLRDEDTVRSALTGIELVSHHAAIVGRGKEILDAAHHVSCNDLATGILLAEMTRQGIERAVLASSVAIYGSSNYDCAEHGRVTALPRTRADLDAGRFEPRCPYCGGELTQSAVREEDPLDPPRNIYAITKLAQEYLLSTWAQETGAQAIALRYHNVYGPEIGYGNAYSGVAAVFRSAVARGDAPTVYEDGGPLRDFVHVDDIIAANMIAFASDTTGFRAYNVASGTPHSIGEMATELAMAAGAPAPVVTGKYRIGDVRHIVASPDRLMRETGWRPTIGFEAGMKEFALAPIRGFSPGVSA